MGTEVILVAAALALVPKPLMQDFIGLNVHTVLFRPEQYRPVAKLLRDYHGFNWDVGEDSDHITTFPLARNGVDWKALYEKWSGMGYRTSVCLMFDQIEPAKWKNLDRDAETYARAFGSYFGPTGWVEAIEVGNEPGKWDDMSYRRLVIAVSKGIRATAPKLKVVTAAMKDQPSGEYHKNLATVADLGKEIDVLNFHDYAEAEGWPTWRRSYPEDPKIEFMNEVRSMVAWRDRNMPGKPIWMTEFGWDSTTQPQAKEGTFKDWVGVTDLQQAQFIVRAFLLLSGTPLERAYLYWFNDDDQASVHAAAGLTRKYVPKPSFHAVAHLQQALGATRLAAKPVDRADLKVYEYRGAAGTVWAVWSPTGSGKAFDAKMPKAPGPVVKTERMALAAGTPPSVAVKRAANGALSMRVDETPVFVWFGKPKR